MRSVDLKSFLIGGLLVALVLCFLGGAAPSVLFYEMHGRFQIAVNEEWAFMADTATGQVWSQEINIPGPNGGTDVFDDPNCAFCLPKLDLEGMAQIRNISRNN